MAVIYTQADYEGNFIRDPYRLPGQPHYHDDPEYERRSSAIRGRFSIGKILVAGCGYGYTVRHLINLGIDAWGIDASAYAVQQASTIVPGRVTQANILIRSELTACLTFAGLKTNQKFTAIVTEDVLTCLTDAEIVMALTELRRIGTVVFHIVNAVELEANRLLQFNWKTPAQWKTVVGTESVLTLESYTVL